jgi:heme-degrading monooxygenase HmoA
MSKIVIVNKTDLLKIHVFWKSDEDNNRYVQKHEHKSSAKSKRHLAETFASETGAE